MRNKKYNLNGWMIQKTSADSFLSSIQKQNHRYAFMKIMKTQASIFRVGTLTYLADKSEHPTYRVGTLTYLADKSEHPTYRVGTLTGEDKLWLSE